MQTETMRHGVLAAAAGCCLAWVAAISCDGQSASSVDAGFDVAAPARTAQESSRVGAGVVSDCADGRWVTVQQSEHIIALVFGASNAQFGAIHTDSSYVRFVPSQAAGWGTSLILAPAFWRDGSYYQATPIAVTFAIECDRLRMSFSGTLGGLPFDGVLTLRAPTAAGIAGEVELFARTAFAPDDRPAESFKLAMLSSMHVSPTQWDTKAARAGDEVVPISAREGWILPAPVATDRFGLEGGSSEWKPRAPSVMLELLDRLDARVTGWVTASRDPNDDNVGMWIAVPAVPPRYSYRFSVSTAP